MPVSDYREVPPPPSLAGHVLCLWTQRIGEGGTDYAQLVVPDACVDLLWVDDAAPAVAGPATRAFVASLPPGTTIVGARCRPGLAGSLLGVAASDILDQEAAPLRDVCRRLAGRLSDRVAGERSIPGKLAVVDTVLTAHLAEVEPADDLVVAAVGWLARHPTGRVQQLVRSMGVSPRQLHRRFGAAVGYGPKVLQRILRLQRLLTLATRGSARVGNLSSLALAAGYADHAHMAREVRSLTGRRPTTVLSSVGTALAMSDLFKTGAASGPTGGGCSTGTRGTPPRRSSGGPA